MREYLDMIGNRIKLKETPIRIISLVPSQTELLFDLGLENQVVGITKFCIHPDQWFRTKKRIGGTKSVHIDVIAGLKPDLILANKEENVAEQIYELQKIAPVWVSDIHTLDDALLMTGAIGSMCKRIARANEIIGEIRSSFFDLRNDSPVSAAYAIWRNPWMWAGNDTFIHDLMQRAGFHNVLAEMPRYPELSLQELQKMNPEIVMLSSEPFPFKEKHIREVQSILPDARIILVDGEMFSWYGSRLLQVPPYFRELRAQLK